MSNQTKTRAAAAAAAAAAEKKPQVQEFIPKPSFFTLLDDGANHPKYYATANNRIAFCTISPDDEPLRPVSVQWGMNGPIDHADMDGEGTIFIIRSQEDEDYAYGLINRSHGIPLSKYEHGLVKWDVGGSLDDAPDAQWDLSRFAGVWVPDDQVFENIGNKGRKSLLKYCKPIIDRFTAYCNGDVWAYEIVIYPVMRDSNGVLITDRTEYEDTLAPLATIDEAPGQYYGDESVIEEIESELQHRLKGRMFDGYGLTKGRIDLKKHKYRYDPLPPIEAVMHDDEEEE